MTSEHERETTRPGDNRDVDGQHQDGLHEDRQHEDRQHQDPQRGASLVEYALLLALIAVACAVAVSFLGNTASGGLSSSASSIFGP